MSRAEDLFTIHQIEFFDALEHNDSIPKLEHAQHKELALLPPIERAEYLFHVRTMLEVVKRLSH